MAFTHGLMDDSMKANTTMTRSMGLGFTLGLMDEDMREIGNMGNNMELVSLYKKERKRLEFGNKVKELNG